MSVGQGKAGGLAYPSAWPMCMFIGLAWALASSTNAGGLWRVPVDAQRYGGRDLVQGLGFKKAWRIVACGVKPYPVPINQVGDHGPHLKAQQRPDHTEAIFVQGLGHQPPLHCNIGTEVHPHGERHHFADMDGKVQVFEAGRAGIGMHIRWSGGRREGFGTAQANVVVSVSSLISSGFDNPGPCPKLAVSNFAPLWPRVDRKGIVHNWQNSPKLTQTTALGSVWADGKSGKMDRLL